MFMYMMRLTAALMLAAGLVAEAAAEELQGTLNLESVLAHVGELLESHTEEVKLQGTELRAIRASADSIIAAMEDLDPGSHEFENADSQVTVLETRKAALERDYGRINADRAREIAYALLRATDLIAGRLSESARSSDEGYDLDGLRKRLIRTGGQVGLLIRSVSPDDRQAQKALASLAKNLKYLKNQRTGERRDATLDSYLSLITKVRSLIARAGDVIAENRSRIFDADERLDFLESLATSRIAEIDVRNFERTAAEWGELDASGGWGNIQKVEKLREAGSGGARATAAGAGTDIDSDLESLLEED